MQLDSLGCTIPPFALKCIENSSLKMFEMHYFVADICSSRGTQ